MRGRLEREESAPTLGIPAGTPVRRTDAGSAKRREATVARRETERLRQELDDAAAREERMRESVERTAETLRQEKARLTEAKRETAKLRRDVKAAQRKAT
jgi:dsDNA-specific endonuclease/ATPase MutS2